MDEKHPFLQGGGEGVEWKNYLEPKGYWPTSGKARGANSLAKGGTLSWFPGI